jgi:hypothetical protein
MLENGDPFSQPFDFIFMLESGDPLLLGTKHALLFASDVIFPCNNRPTSLKGIDCNSIQFKLGMTFNFHFQFAIIHIQLFFPKV